MKNDWLRAWPQVIWLALNCVGARGNDYFVATNGTEAGPGTLSQPYDLTNALSGEVGQPGDTFWLRAGDYKLGHLNTMIHGAPGNPITFRGVRGEKARIDGSLSLFDSPGYLVFRDFELYSSDTNRISSQTNAGFDPTDITILTGIACYVPNASFINLVVHDQTRGGFYTVEDSTNSLIYGCLVYNNGWRSPDNSEGHGLYIQGTTGARTAAQNIICNNCGVGMHIYENGTNLPLVGVTLDRNTVLGAGALQQVRSYLDWIVGVDMPGTYADDIVLNSNLGYQAPGRASSESMQVGRDGINGSVVLSGNYMPLGLQFNNWTTAMVEGNLFAPLPGTYVIALNQTQTSLNAWWNYNTYICDPTGGQILFDTSPYSFDGWQQLTGYDQDSLFVVGDLHGTKVFLLPNDYEVGRANIAVYNWDNLGTVSVDVKSVLPMGTRFEVRNAQDFYSPPVLSGIYHGQRLMLPMSNLTVAAPNARLLTPPPTGPTFNVFVLLPLPPPLQIVLAGDNVQVSWPIGLDINVLQSAQGLVNPVTWVNATNAPVVYQDRYMISEPVRSSQKYYRLRPQ